MAKPLALLLLLMAPARDYAWVPFHEALKQAELVVVGELVEIKVDPQGKKTAVVHPEVILKGECAEKLLQLPIYEHDARIACPPPEINFVKGAKHFLLLSGKPLRVIDAQF
jgi:hypothetical protein